MKSALKLVGLQLVIGGACLAVVMLLSLEQRGFMLSMGPLTSVQGLWVTLGAVGVVLVVQGPVLWRTLPASVLKVKGTYEGRVWLRVSLPLLLVSGFMMIHSETDILMIGTLLGPQEAGIYRAASKTAGFVAFVLVATAAAAAPTIAALYARGDLEKLQRLLSVLAHWTFWPSLAMVLVLAVASVPVLRLFGPEFVAGRWAFLVLAGGNLVPAGAGAVVTLLSMTGHHNWVALVLGWSVLLNVMLNAVCIFLLGFFGAALATALSITVTNVFLVVVIDQKMKVNPSIIYALLRKTRSTQ